MSTIKIEIDINISRRFKMARNFAGMEQDEAAGLLSVSVVTLSRYENAKRSAPDDTVKKMSSVYGVSLHWLLTGEGPMMEASQATLTSIIDAEQVKGNVRSRGKNDAGVQTAIYSNLPPSVPLISWAKAGGPSPASVPGDHSMYALYPGEIKPGMFALTIDNESMSPEFNPGDGVVVDPDKPASTGAFVVARVGNEAATLKKYVKDGGRVYLQPLNRAYPVMEITGHDFRIVGVVVFKWKGY